MSDPQGKLPNFSGDGYNIEWAFLERLLCVQCVCANSVYPFLYLPANKKPNVWAEHKTVCLKINTDCEGKEDGRNTAIEQLKGLPVCFC